MLNYDTNIVYLREKKNACIIKRKKKFFSAARQNRLLDRGRVNILLNTLIDYDGGVEVKLKKPSGIGYIRLLFLYLF